MRKNITIVGAGLFGITLANILSDKHNIVIIDRRNHIGGNCYDYVDKDTGIIVQKYGPHILHINDQKVINFIRKFTDFNEYKHSVLTYYNGKLYDFPINLNTINSFFNSSLKPYELEMFFKKNGSNYDNYNNLEDQLIKMIGNELYEAFFKEYTVKQWGKHPKYLPPSLISRIPIRYNYETNYYKKRFNGMPAIGYTSMFNNMLRNTNIQIHLNTDYFDIMHNLNYDLLVFTGPIDKFFNYKYGRLDYRSLNFLYKYYDVQDFQGKSVINYPELKYAYTRVCEPKHFYPERESSYYLDKTIVVYEIPCADNGDAPYYPINDDRNQNKYKKYYDETKKFHDVIFGGRLGEYKYYDMEDCIKSAMLIAEKI